MQALSKFSGLGILLLAAFIGLAIIFPPDLWRHMQATGDTAVPTGATIATFEGHTLNIVGLAWSPDGTRIVSAGHYGDIQGWDAQTGKRLRIYPKALAQVNTLAWSPNGKWIAEGEHGGLVHIWDAATGQNLQTYSCHCYSISELAWSPDSTQIASLNEGRGVETWSLAERRELASYGDITTSSQTLIAGWYASGLYLIASDLQGTQLAWNATTGKEIFVHREKPDPQGAHSDLALSPDGKHLAVLTPNESIQLWNVTTQTQVATISPTDAASFSLSWSPDSRYLAASTGAGIQIWDARTGSDFFTYTSRNRPDGAFWSPDGTKIASSNGSSSVVIWQARGATSPSITSWQLPPFSPLTGVAVVSILFIVSSGIFFAMRPPGSSLWLLPGISVIAFIGITNIALLARTLSPPLQATPSTSSRPSPVGTDFFSYRGESAAWSPDGARLAIGLSDGTTFIWDAATGQLLLSHHRYHSAINALVWSPDGQAIATGYDNGYVEVWGAQAGDSLFLYKEHSGKVVSVIWSPDGRRIASLSSPDHTILIWQAPLTAGGQSLGSGLLNLICIIVFGFLSIAATLALCFYCGHIQNSQRRRLTIIGLALIGLFSLMGVGIALPSIIPSALVPFGQHTPTGTTLAHHQGTSMVWSPDGASLASTNGGSEVEIWQADGGKRLFTFMGSSSAITALAWSPDQHYLATGTVLGMVQVWNATTGHVSSIYQLHNTVVTTLAWSRDGKRIASGGENVQIWDAFTGGNVFFYLGQPGTLTALSWSPDGMRIASTDNRGLVKIWQGATKTDDQLMPRKGEEGALFSPLLITGIMLGLVILCTLAAILLRRSPHTTRQHLNRVALLLFTFTSIADFAAQMPLLHQAQTLAYISPTSATTIYEYPANSGIWSPDGKHFVTYQQSVIPFLEGTDKVQIWHDQQGDLDLIYHGYSDQVTALAWSHDSTKIATGYHNGMVQIWDAHTGRNLFQYHGQTTAITSLGWSPDNSTIVSFSEDNLVQAWSVTTGDQRFHGSLGQIICGTMIWSPDGSRLLFACTTVQIWDASSGKKLLAVPSTIDGVPGATWSPDSKRFLMEGDSDGTIQERDALTGNLILTFPTITEQIISDASFLAWSHNDKYIASANSSTGRVQLWDAKTGQALRNLGGARTQATFLAWSPDDKYLAIGADTYLQVWQMM